MRQYKSYHTTLKQLANKGHLPDMYLNQIYRTTLWRWRMEPNDKYTGNELSNMKFWRNLSVEGKRKTSCGHT